MRDCHVDIDQAQVTFEFHGKSGIEHAITLEDQRLAKIIQQCQEIPGYELFQYADEDQRRQTIDPGDVNDYLQQVTEETSATKDFRTWKGTVLAARELRQVSDFEDERQPQRYVRETIKRVAKQLGNRPTTCRKYYVHPVIIETYIEAKLLSLMQQT